MMIYGNVDMHIYGNIKFIYTVSVAIILNNALLAGIGILQIDMTRNGHYIYKINTLKFLY